VYLPRIVSGHAPKTKLPDGLPSGSFYLSKIIWELPAVATATTAATATATTAASASATVVAALGTRTRLVHGQGAAVELKAVNRSLGCGCIIHLDETETAGLSRVAVSNQVDGRDGAERAKRITETVFGRVEIQVADV
jgi:hypothetical protein